MSMGGIGLVTNPNSRKNLKLRHNGGLIFKQILGDTGIEHITRNPDDIIEACREFYEKDIDILCINGGDGSNQITLTAMIEVYGEKPLPYIVPMRGGSMNALADSAGIKGTPQSILGNIVAKNKNKQDFEIAEYDIMKVNDLYGFAFSNGLGVNFLKEYYKASVYGTHRGILMLTKGVLAAFVKNELTEKLYQPFKAEVLVDGEPIGFDEYQIMFVGTMESVGLKTRVLYRANEQPSWLHILAFAMSPRQIGMNLLTAMRGIPIKNDKLYDNIAREVIIKTDEPQQYTIDGEMLDGPNEMVLTTGPRVGIIKK